LKQGGFKTIKRCQVLVVGHGGAGKTTLVHRLERDTFDSRGPGSTDGIVMSSLMIDDVEFSFLDFAGQEVYDHTHSLFFRSEAVFLVLHNPMIDNLDRLDEFFVMIGDKAVHAQVIVVTTRAEEATLREDKIDELHRKYSNIVDIEAIDSRTNKGIDGLKSKLTAAALNKVKLPRTITEVPIKFAKLLVRLKELSGSFSIPFESFVELSSTFSIDAESAVIAKELFCFWGMLFELSNGDLVLNPQQLADVLACVFTKEPEKIVRMGDIAYGVLGHHNSIVEAVWGGSNSLEYPKHLWSFQSSRRTQVPPFLDLLYRAELGYPLYGPTGIQLGATFIPALLPDRPIGYDAQLSSGLMDYFKLNSIGRARHPDVVLSFTKPNPQRAFVAQLIVRLRRYSVVDGVWKHGAVMRGDDGSGNYSTCIFYVEENQMTVLSVGSSKQSTGARSIFFNELLKLVAEKYSTLRADSIQFGNVLLNSSDVDAALQDGDHISYEGSQFSLKGLSALFKLDSSHDTGHLRSSELIDSKNSLRSIANIKPNSDGVLAGDDRVNLVYRLLNSISYILSLQGLRTLGDKGIHTLWVVYRSTVTKTNSTYAIAPGAKPSLTWQLVEASEIPLDEKLADDRNFNTTSEMIEVSEILKTALFVLDVVDPNKFDYVGLRNMRDVEIKIKSKEIEFFTPIDDLPTAHYVLKSSLPSAMSSFVSDHIKDLKYNLNLGFAEIGFNLNSIERQEKQVMLPFL